MLRASHGSERYRGGDVLCVPLERHPADRDWPAKWPALRNPRISLRQVAGACFGPFCRQVAGMGFVIDAVLGVKEDERHGIVFPIPGTAGAGEAKAFFHSPQLLGTSVSEGHSAAAGWRNPRIAKRSDPSRRSGDCAAPASLSGGREVRASWSEAQGAAMVTCRVTIAVLRLMANMGGGNLEALIPAPAPPRRSEISLLSVQPTHWNCSPLSPVWLFVGRLLSGGFGL